jgi:hypothetical protein
VGHYGGTRTNHVPKHPPLAPSPLITRSISKKEGDEKLEKEISLEKPSPAMTKKKPIIVFRYYSLKVCCIQSKSTLWI